MNAKHLIRLLIVTLGSITLATVVYAQKEKTAAAEAAPAKWSDIQDLGYEARPQFFAGLKRIEAAVDRQISELTAKRATMNRDTTDWDFAMKEMNDARAYLEAMGVEAGSATAELWEQQKAKIGDAWRRTQTAYDKVKASTTD
jgi:hypothetical protein